MQWHVTRQRAYPRLVAQEPEVAGFEFRIGDAFPADDPMARYVVRLSMALGDLRIAGAEYAARERAGPRGLGAPERDRHSRFELVRPERFRVVGCLTCGRCGQSGQITKGPA